MQKPQCEDESVLIKVESQGVELVKDFGKKVRNSWTNSF